MISAKNRKKKNRIISFSLVAVFLVALAIWSCNGIHFSGEYDAFTDKTKTDSVLIKPAKLKEWIDAGYVNNDDSFSKVVILDVTFSTTNLNTDEYSLGHIPGAQLWDSSADSSERIEGPGKFAGMVPDGTTMDGLIQAHGVDGRTTIVITSAVTTASDSWRPSRLYFILRYWGWPKNKLKVLDGYNSGWAAAGYSLVQEVPKINPTTYSVQGNGTFNPDLRASLSEMITAVKKGTGIPLEARYDTTDYSTVDRSSTATESINTTERSATFVVFEGLIKGGQLYYYPNYHVNAPTDFTFKDKATIQTELGLPIDGSKMVYTYCRTGMKASTAFFVFEVILEWDVTLYDGSWAQWGQMSSVATNKKGALLDSSSPWITDSSALTDYIDYNVDRARVIETLIYAGSGLPNLIEDEDADYMNGIMPAGAAAPAADSGGY